MEFPATWLVLLVTGVTTYVAFRRPDLRDRWIFNPTAVLANKEYERLLTSGLIHLDWMHFGMNAFSFYSFARIIELEDGWATMLFIYLAAILGGSLLSLVIHRHHDYRALGASGGVCGIIFASIFLIPGNSIMIFPLPLHVPAYLYAIIFLVASFIGHRRQLGKIGHDAHLGGAIIGLLVATALYPQRIFAAPYMFASVLGLSLVILLGLIFDPLQLLERRFERSARHEGGERERRYSENREHNRKVAEIDALLEKISSHGIQSLNDAERQRLEQLSREIRKAR